MINYWEIRLEPYRVTRNRYRLYIDGDSADVRLVLKYLGSVCGRPEKAPAPYTYSMFFTDTDPAFIQRAEETMAKIVKQSAAVKKKPGHKDEQYLFKSLQRPAKGFVPPEPKRGHAAPPAAAPELGSIPKYSPQEKPFQIAEPAPPAPDIAVVNLEASAAEADTPALPPEPVSDMAATVAEARQEPETAPAPEIPFAAAEPARELPEQPVLPVQPPPIPPLEKTAFNITIPAPEASPAEAAMPAAEEKTFIIPPSAPAQPPPQPAVLDTPAPQEETREDLSRITLRYKPGRKRRHKWPIEIPLTPTYTFDALVPGANRFAHAAAATAISSSGSMYNPLLLYGARGAGKTHFLNAIGYGLAASLGQESIYVTDGVRLSRGAQRMFAEGKIDKLDETISSAKALIVDDIHLLALSEDNKPYISKWLNTFVKEDKQVVLSSAYPPKNLARLEESLAFELGQGWMGELKPLSASVYRTIISGMLESRNMMLSQEEAAAYFSPARANPSAVLKDIRRVKILEKMLPIQDPPPSTRTLFDLVLGPGETYATSAPDREDLEKARGFKSPESASWGRWGFFCPQGSHEYIAWVAFGIMESAKELGINGGFEPVFKYDYEYDNLLMTAFNIADICDEQDLQGAVIIGPPFQQEEGALTDFFDVLSHMLDSMMVRCGCIEYDKMKSPSAYVRLVTDLIR